MLADPSAADTFARSTLDHGERISHAADVALHRSLIALRLSDAAFQGEHFDIDGAVVGERAFVLRWTDRRAEGDTAKQDRLLLVNLGGDELLPTVAEPLLSPFPDTRWRTIWSSDDPAFGGPGRREIDQTWRLPAQCALVLETHS
jgi:maltooligosyltrehalose trehalohydrolase